ncbi:MAG TPA: sugar transferase [Anaerolineaceae bacterium]|nr:sugar transferase [Anaerolineaceae bacterium]
MVLDGLVVGLALRFAVAARPLLNSIPGIQSLSNDLEIPQVLYYIFPVLWIGILLAFSTYDGRKNFRVADEFGSLTGSSLLAMVAMAGVLYLSFRDVSRALFLFFCAMAFAGLLLWRAWARVVFRWRLRTNTARRRVIILGAGEGGQQLQKMICGQPGLGLDLVGFLDDDLENCNGREVLGPLSRIRRVIADCRVDDVVVALPRSASDRLNWVVAELHDLPVKVWIIPDYFSLALHRATVEEFAGIPMLDLRAPALSEYQRIVKRGFDLLVTFLMSPFVLLVGLPVALAIKIDSPGPVFYQARRIGENGRLFDMYKFRTMVQNADQLRPGLAQINKHGIAIFVKRRDDPRITRVGRLLRRTSLDELPQLINVVRGEMSLVGPRPEVPELVEKYELWQRKRFAIPQGMTGWWQIHGRSDKPMHLHTEEDLYYVQHYSVWLDLQILVTTIWVVLRAKGAY